MSNCGTPYPTATLYQPTTTVLPSIVTYAVDGPTGAVIASIFTTYYTTTVQIPTSTLYATPPCSTSDAGGVVVTSNGVTTRASATATTTRTSTQTLTSALATVSDGTGGQSVVYLTYTQTLASQQPVLVTVIAPAPSASSGTNSAATDSTSSTHIAPIVGGVIGGALALALLVLFFVWARRRRRNRHQVGLDELFKRSSGKMGLSPGASSGVSRNNSGLSTKDGGNRSSDDAEEDMIEGQIGNGIVPTLARARSVMSDGAASSAQGGGAGWGAHGVSMAQSRMSLPPTWPLTISTAAANNSLAAPAEGTKTLGRSTSEASNRAKSLASPTGSHHASTPPAGRSDPNTPNGDAGIDAIEAAWARNGRPASYAGANVRSTPTSPVSPDHALPSIPQGTPPAGWYGSVPRHNSFNAQLARPRSVGDMDMMVGSAATGGDESGSVRSPNRPLSPGYYSATQSPPFRATSPSVPQRTISPGPISPTHQQQQQQQQQRTQSPMMWRNGPRQSLQHRTLSWGSGSLTQLTAAAQATATTSGGSSSSSGGPQQQRNAFGVQPIRRETASPPPLGAPLNENWPPSRYSHLDVHGQGGMGQSHSGSSGIGYPLQYQQQLSPSSALSHSRSSGSPSSPNSPNFSANASTSSSSGAGSTQRLGSNQYIQYRDSYYRKRQAQARPLSTVAPSEAGSSSYMTESEHYWKTPASPAPAGPTAVVRPTAVLATAAASTPSSSYADVDGQTKDHRNGNGASSMGDAKIHTVGDDARTSGSGVVVDDDDDDDAAEQSAIRLHEAETKLWGRSHKLFVTNAEAEAEAETEAEADPREASR